MSANLQKQVDGLEKRTDSLENILGQFISSMNSTLTRMEADTRAFREEIRADTKAFREEIRADTKALKNEMKTLKKETNKRWGELANKMGTLVEDIAAPNIPGIAAEYFGDRYLTFFGIRIRKPRGDSLSDQREFDVVAVSEKNFYINETKSKPRPEDVRDFVSVLEELPDYFPECRGRKVIPVFSSLYIPEEIVIHLSRNGIYAMAMREDTMDLLNFDEVVGK
ncbi:hypothetical protein [Desulfonema magnum]|uniref:Restriction endonuclease domain-containing protein n=1 Tax=Desulfonema magnum TaxID=45655 RepID=A0A975BWA2_9BACT|nr:hypothetical protein [Desulfonema magnum]QTA92320.1 restriction endonuclease domain-containing protein [Desulfonema magnum]